MDVNGSTHMILVKVANDADFERITHVGKMITLVSGVEGVFVVEGNVGDEGVDYETGAAAGGSEGSGDEDLAQMVYGDPQQSSGADAQAAHGGELIEDDIAKEIYDQVHEEGIQLTRDQIQKLYGKRHSLLGMAREWGVSDTEVRSDVTQVVLDLLGCGYPRDDEDQLDVLRKARAQGFTLTLWGDYLLDPPVPGIVEPRMVQELITYATTQGVELTEPQVQELFGSEDKLVDDLRAWGIDQSTYKHEQINAVLDRLK